MNCHGICPKFEVLCIMAVVLNVCIGRQICSRTIKSEWKSPSSCMFNKQLGYIQGAAKKVIPVVFCKFLSNRFEFFDETLQLYSLFTSTYNCQISFNYLQMWQSYVISNATTPRFWRAEKYLLIVKRQEHVTNRTTNFFYNKTLLIVLSMSY